MTKQVDVNRCRRNRRKRRALQQNLLLLLPTTCLFALSSISVRTTAVFAFSVQAPPAVRPMDRKEQKRIMNSIWRYTQTDQENPKDALRLLETLLREEQEQMSDVSSSSSSSSHTLLHRGVVWNVLKSCRHTLTGDDASLCQLETTMELLEKNPRLYQIDMTDYVVKAVIHNDGSDLAQVLMNKHTNTLLKTLEWNQSILKSAKNAIWFHIHSNVDKRDGVEKALLLLERVLQHDNDLTVLSQGMVVNVLRTCQRMDPTSYSSVHALERILPLLEQRHILDTKMLTEVLVAVVKCRNDHAMSRAEVILKSPSLVTSIQRNVYHYCAVLNGYAKLGDAKKAEQLLQSMTDRNIAPNTVACNCVLDALCKSSESKTVERAEHLIKRMNRDRYMTPDVVSYTNMLNIYKKHNLCDKAEALLEHMMALEEGNKLTPGVGELHYRSVIDTFAKSGKAEGAERLVVRMRERNVVPNKFHYCGVLNGYARVGRPLEAERILREMQDTSGLTANVVAYNCVAFAWAKSGEVDAPFRVKALLDEMIAAGLAPDVITYNCLLCACANRSMAKESEKLLKEMRELYEAGQLDSAPNNISYHYVLDSLARSGDRVWTVLRAESLINEMEELQESGQADEAMPNVFHYRSLLKCYANWNLPDDADQLLHRMNDLHESHKLGNGPDRVSYRLVIDALEKSGKEAAQNRAEELKKEAEDKFKASWHEETTVDVVDYQFGAILEYMRE